MLSIFTDLADWMAYTLFGLLPGSKLGGAIHFFIEDTTKIFFLLVLMIYFIALIRASLNIEKVRVYRLFHGFDIWCDYAVLFLF